MVFCPNCGSYIPLGEPYCSCGTTIYYDEEMDSQDSGENYEEYLQRIRNENPYDVDFYNELHHIDVSPNTIRTIDEEITRLENVFNAKFEKGSVYNSTAIVELVKNDKYYDAVLRATYDLSNSFNDLILQRDIVTPDFTKLYSDDDFKRMIKEMEIKTDEEFHYCRLVVIGDELMVSAVFDYRGYIVDLDNMTLIE